MKSENSTISFAPELFIENGIKDISFYTKAFGAAELFRFTNDDGSIHVAELNIGDAKFHIHEITAKSYFFSPDKNAGSTVCIGLFVPDVDEVIKKAVEAGAILISPAESYDYGYRQGTVRDPFGHYWQIQKKI